MVQSSLGVAHNPSRMALVRLANALWRQSSRTLADCPERPRLDDQVALVTGANSGIGRTTAEGLLVRGAEVVLACRDPERMHATLAELRQRHPEAADRLHPLALDLSDLNKVSAAADVLRELLGSRRLDILVANAGLWPLTYGESAQGHEIAFAVNLLGHHLFVRRLLDDGRLTGRLVWVTGDIYILSRRCTPDYRYRGAWGGQLAYSRSKLGVLWMAGQLRERYRNLAIYTVHPGVVDTNLVRLNHPLVDQVKQSLFIGAAKGAQTSLICATQPEPPGYYHNTLGRVELHPHDPARNLAAAQELWMTCEQLCAPWLDAVDE
ncbi:MAG: SDR family NAD(P)-dependent oxidoreductase [Myxococcota bacterium]